MTDDVSREIGEIQQVMREDQRGYYADTAMQSRLLELYDARETGAAASPRRQPDELAAIQKVMKTDLDRYRRDPEMQARYLQLLEEEEEKAGEAVALPSTVPVPGEFARMPTPSDWQRQGNDSAKYDTHTQLVREVNDILGGVDDDARDALGSSFAALPARVHSAAFGMLVDRRPVSVEPFPDTDMEKLAEVPAYRALAREWGQDAPRKMAVLQERLARVLDRLGDADASRALAWFNALPEAAMAAVGRKMGR